MNALVVHYICSRGTRRLLRRVFESGKFSAEAMTASGAIVLGGPYDNDDESGVSLPNNGREAIVSESSGTT